MGDPRTDEATRFVRAAPAAIFDSFMDPAKVVAWLPPAGASGHIDAFQPVAGGAFKMTLTFRNAQGKSSGNTDVIIGRFVQIVPDRLIVLAIEFLSDRDAFKGSMTMRWTLCPREEGTLVAITAENVPAGINAEDHKTGMSSTLENLARFVE